MDNVTVSGGFGGFNIGDEAILRSMTLMIAQSHEYRISDIITFGFGERSIIKDQESSGVKFHNFFKLFNTIILTTRTNLIIGGGAIVQEKGFFWPFLYFSSLIVLNRIAGKRPIILGIGADRPSLFISRLFVRLFFRLAHVITCRDRPSMQMLETLGLPKHKLALTGDFVFALPTIKQERKIQNGRLRILIVPGRDKKRGASATDAMKSIIKHLKGSKEKKYEIVLMPHDLRDDYDRGEVNRIYEALNDSSITVKIPHTLDEAFLVYRSSDLVISNRLHPLIIGTIYSTVPIAAGHTSSKVSACVKLLDIPDLGGPDNVQSKLGILTEIDSDKIAMIRSALTKKADHMRTLAELNLDCLLTAWNA